MPKPGVPPPIALALAALMIFGVDAMAPALRVGLPRPGAWTLLAIGVLIMALGIGAIVRAGTTIDPRRPHESRVLINRGVFAWSRNPIYLADVVLLLALLWWVGQPLGLLAVAAFVIYLDRVQIPAEEAALKDNFGATYESYRARVRRWI